MLSAEGGVEIETVAESNPDAIAKIHVDPAEGLSEADARAWVEAAKLNPQATEGAVDILRARERGVPRYNEFAPALLANGVDRVAP